MEYQPKAIPIEDVLQTVKDISNDTTFEATQYMQKKVQHPKILRAKKTNADMWYSLYQYLKTLSKTK